MKELTIEQKAKRYDEVIEIARKIKNGEPINVPNGTVISDVIFSELKESKDENKDFPNEIWRFIYKKDIIAWLEKHDENTLVEEIKRRKAILLEEKETAVLYTENISLSARIAMIEKLLAFVSEKNNYNI